MSGKHNRLGAEFTSRACDSASCRCPGGLRDRALAALLAVFVGCATLSCERPGAMRGTTSSGDRGARQPTGGGEVLATVNGVPISEWDVVYRLKSSSHKTEPSPEHRKNALETLVREELFRQRAVELGLDGDARYQKGLQELQARVNAFERTELARLFLQREAEQKTAVKEEEARKYFAANESRIRTELHVWQILKKGRKQAVEQALQEIRSGTPFEQVAAAQFPGLPKAAGSPWDLGYLRWQQVPAAWRNVVYDLKPGEVSDVLQGAGNRFWIIKLIDKRENPNLTFESVKATIVDVLESEAAATLHERVERELRAKAQIVYGEDPAANAE